jgi:hypothetical protein
VFYEWAVSRQRDVWLDVAQESKQESGDEGINKAQTRRVVDAD